MKLLHRHVRSPIWLLLVAMLVWLVLPGTLLASDASHGSEGGEALGDRLPLWTLLPFGILLGVIASFPLLFHHWWESNKNRAIVAILLGAPVALYLYFCHDAAGLHALEHSAKEYIAFILLLGSLFFISGGIYVQGSLAGTPLLNTAIIALGGLLASFIGTTGASMLLIRPLLRANASRERKAHLVVFFIFVVSNCGGLLTPLGDPPLFLGFLHGVPFEWTFSLWREWLAVNIALLVIFNIWDQIVLTREEGERAGSQLEEVLSHEPLRIKGLHNFLFLGGIVVTIYGSGSGLFNQGQVWPFGVSESLMFVLALASFLATSSEIRRKNHFSVAPIVEVAVIFAGIFVTMIPAMAVLNARGGSGLGLEEPWHYFWATGLLSGFLDNAPTYLTFAATACGMKGVPLVEPYMKVFLEKDGADAILAAISCGAVFMGALTYIGNGPNFMVKAIAEENGVRMPSFFGYMVYSIAILLPILIVITFMFFV